MIEKLDRYHDGTIEIIDKINEIIDFLNDTYLMRVKDDVQEWMDEQPTVNPHEYNNGDNTVCISKEEYKALLEYKAMYEDLCR